MLGEELSTDMDRITQLQDAILDLLTISHTSIEYITKRGTFVQTSPNVPVTTKSPLTAKPEEYRATLEAFVADIVKRAKDVETLIAALPRRDDSGQRAARVAELQEEIKLANEEYKGALAEAEEVLAALNRALADALGDKSSVDVEAVEQ